jgi:hypothetical protein
MKTNLPQITVPRVPSTWAAGADPFQWDWAQGVVLPPFLLADGSGPARQQTITRLCYNDAALFVHFDAVDNEIWGTYTQRNDPIYDEEVVEIFIGPGGETPVDYYEFEVSPNGVLLDVQVHNPRGDRADMQLDFGWDCPGLRWGAQRADGDQRWQVFYAIPWASIGAPTTLPTVWRANFYRIDRPRNGPPEFSCWSPTLTDPADFHKPAQFGMLTLLP